MVLYAQILDGRTKIRAGKNGVAGIVEHLGYVQIDTISVIERAHHHTLRTRISGYKPEHLHLAQTKDKTIFEYWGHAASYLPMKDYRFYLPLMESFYNPKNLGIASEREIRDYIRIGNRTQVANAIRDMFAAAEITGVKVAGQDGLAYALPSVLEEVGRFKARTPHVYLLSPFDNLVIFRPRLKERFGFDYAFECYVPKHRRNYGYFVLPILFGEKIVGRLDPKANRAGGTLTIRRLTIEQGFADFDLLIPELSRALYDLARFNGCRSIRLENVRPKKLLVPLNKALD